MSICSTGLGRRAPLTSGGVKTRARSPPAPEQELRPALISIAKAAAYIGVGKAKFYQDIVALVETVKIGNRHLVVLKSLDAYVERLRRHVEQEQAQPKVDAAE